ncbi:MAG: type II toxin-antitoxin system VapC family toxin [Acidobacteriota bacterium]
MLDTSAYIGLRRGHPLVLDAMAEASNILLPTTVLGELEAGFELAARSAENRAALEDFLAEPFVAIRPITRQVAQQYGKLFAALRRAGTPIPLNDVWIAAASVVAGARLLTFDHHFERISGLDLRRLKADE